MIVFDLCCTTGHRFEGWFGSTADFDTQGANGMLTCPECGSPDVTKAPMAPSVPAKSNRRSEAVPSGSAPRPVSNVEMAPEVVKAMKALAKAQAKALKDSTWVGDKFAEKSRAMHYGEADSATIHGQATIKEAKELADEGISVAPLPFPIAPPEDVN